MVAYRLIRESSENGTSSLVEVEPKKKKKPTSSEQMMGAFARIEINGEIYTVQTEDLGINKGEIVTLIYLDGQIVKETKYSYQKHIGHPNFNELLPKAIQMNHEAAIRAFRKEKGDTGITPTPIPLRAPAEPVELKSWDMLLQRLEAEKQTKKRRASWDDIVRARRREVEAEAESK